MVMDLSGILSRPLDGTTKGLPFDAVVTPATVKERGWNVLREDLHFPLMVLNDSALDHNIKAMAAWCKSNGFLIAPHGKTNMCPQIFRRQLEAGAFGVTVANVAQALIYARFGVERILLANQVAGAGGIRALAGAMRARPGLECYCLVDSVEGVRLLASALRECGAQRPLHALIEWGRAGWRTGARTVRQALEIQAEILAYPDCLLFGGIEAYEAAGHDPAGEEAEVRQIRHFLADAVELSRVMSAWASEPSEPLLFSLGSSSYLDLVAVAFHALQDQWLPVLRSGCYVTHDHGVYAAKLANTYARSGAGCVPEWRQAFELWSHVQSVQDAGRAILTFGKRDCPYDAGNPVPLSAVAPGRGLEHSRPIDRARIVDLNDQHAFLDYPPDVELLVGDRIRCGVSHPCATFDRWRVIPLIDDDYNVIDLYITFF
jgi:D-serine dehydratase